MSKILSIANRRVDAALENILEGLDQAYEAMLRKHSASGELRSGNTIKQAMNLVSEASDALKKCIVEQSGWVIKQSIYVPLSISDDLLSLCNKNFDLYREKSESYIKKSTEMSGQPNLFSNIYPDVEKSIGRHIKEARLEIEALVLENRSSGIKGIAKYLFSMVSKLWGG
jgi:hypothetical protein